MKPNFKIVITLILTIVILVCVVIWGDSRKIRYDLVDLEKPGLTFDSDQNTFQFDKGSILYRSWNKDELIGSETEDNSVKISLSSILFFENQSVLFTEKVPIIDKEGLSEKTVPREEYNFKLNEYSMDSSKIAEGSIVKLANRQYYFNENAELYVGGKKIKNVSRPLLLLDKTGSVVVFENNKKSRYLGDMTLKINDDTVLDVSKEEYRIGERIIDLTSFGGSDNEKLVVEEKEKQEKEKQEKEKQEKEKQEKEKQEKEKQEKVLASENAGNGINDADSKEGKKITKKTTTKTIRKYNTGLSDDTTKGSSNGKSAEKSKGSSNGKSNEESNDNNELEDIENYEELLAKLEELNKGMESKIPELRIGSIIPEVTSAEVNFSIIDVSQTLLGVIQLDIVDIETDEIIETIDVSNLDKEVQISGLVPEKNYYLIFNYQYDLGDNKGIQNITVQSPEFSTQSVNALYKLRHVTSSSLDINVSLDAVVKDVKSVNVIIEAVDGSSSFTIKANGNLLNNGGEDIMINKLLPKVFYTIQIELELGNNKKLLLNSSPRYSTLEDTTLTESDAILTEKKLLMVSYKWDSFSYSIEDVDVLLHDTATNMLVPHQVIYQGENTISVIPETEKNNIDLKVELLLDTSHKEENDQKLFSYDLKNTINYNKNADFKIKKYTLSKDDKLIFNDLDIGVIDKYELLFSLKPDIENIASYRVITERRMKKIENDSVHYVADLLTTETKNKWIGFKEQIIPVVTDGIIEDRYEISKLTYETFDFRIAVYDDLNNLLFNVYPEK